MKKPAITALVLLPLLSLSQISIISSDMPAIGDTVSRNVDTLTTYTQGNSGPGQIWNFSNAVTHILNNSAILSPSSTPYNADFPGSNMAMSNDNIGFAYFDLTGSSMIIDGGAGDLLNNGLIIKAPFNPDLILYQFPTAYLNNFTDTYGYDVKTDGSSFSPFIDSVRLKHTGTVYDTVDAWGTTITPIGSYNTLRVKRVEYSLDSIWTKALDPGFPFPPPNWMFFQAIVDTTTTYSWLAKETKLAVAELNFDSLGDPNRLTWSLMPALPVAQFSYTDNGSGSFTFTDQSVNSPISWFWNFGDGNTSNSPNPFNQYTTDATYYVCLTVTNAAGSNTYCDSVLVTGATANPPPVAMFTFVDNGGGSVSFTDQSFNAPNSWLWVFGDGNTSTSQNPSNTYTVKDSAYMVCLTAANGNGSDTFCNSVFVADSGGIIIVSYFVGGENIRIYPNPASESINFSVNGIPSNGMYVFTLYNMLGQVIIYQKLLPHADMTVKLNRGDLPNGTYFYSVKNKQDNSRMEGKIILW